MNNPAKAKKWVTSGEWNSGLTLKVHSSAAIQEFYSQYAKNPERWNRAFSWLNETDLQKVPAGKYLLDDDKVFVSVNEGITKDKDEIKWEAHLKYIDIQYVSIGREIIGVAPLSKAISIEPFSQEKDIGFYEVPEADCSYYTAEPGIFFIFFPQDVHRPGIKAKTADAVKKIVIKIKIQ